MRWGGEAADIRLQTFLRYGPEMVEFFHQRTAVQFLSGSAMPDFHPSPGAANGGRSVTAQPYDGRLLGDWLHRLRPPLETISTGGMGIAGGADMAHFFNATRSPRSALYAARRLLRHGWQRLRAGRGQHLVNGNALVARLLRSALDAGVRFQLNAPVVRLLQGPPGVSGASCAATAGRFTSKLAPWCWPAAVFPTIASGWRRWCLTLRRVTAISPPHRRTIRARDQAWRIRRRPVRHFPAPPAGTGAGVPRHSGQRPAANVSSSGGARQTRGDRRPAQRQTFC